MIRKLKGKKIAVLIAAKSVGNIPRMLNLAQNLQVAGVNVIQIGRQASGSRRYIKKGRGHWVLNIKLWSAKIPFTFIRQPLILIEFIIRSRIALTRVQPNYLFTFYNTAAILHRFKYPFSTKKIAWLLDFRHPYFLNYRHRILEKVGESGCKYSDAIVVPTRERLALHLCRRPECLNIPSFIIHNSPNSISMGHDSFLRKNKETFKGYDDRVSVIYAGGIGKGYGLEKIIKAVGSCPQGIRLLLVGKKRYVIGGSGKIKLDSVQSTIEQECKCVPYPSNIEWRDAVPYEELGELLRQADIGYVTYEGKANLNDRFSAPGKLYDYLREGLVLLTDEQNPIFTELVTADCAVFFSVSANEDQMKEVLEEKILNQKEKIPEMKIAARNLFNNYFCQEKQINPLFAFLGISE